MKTKFTSTTPDKPSTIITSAFMNSVYHTNGGHRHDGVDADGHSSKILPGRDIDAKTGAPLEGYLLKVQDNQTCDWEAPADPVIIPVYPQIENVTNTLQNGISWSGSTLSVVSGTFTLMGTLRYKVNPDYVKNFTLAADKTYHLRFTRYGYRDTLEWKSIAPVGTSEKTFYLGDLGDTTATGYNRYSLSEYHMYFDSKYDDMLVAKIVTNSSSEVSDYIFYINRANGFFTNIDLAYVNLRKDGEFTYPRYELNKISRSFIAHITIWATMRAIGRDWMEARLRYYYPDNSHKRFLTIAMESTEEKDEVTHRSNRATSSASGIFQIGRNCEFDVYAKAFGTKPGQNYEIYEGGITVHDTGITMPFISDHHLYNNLYNGDYGFNPKKPFFSL